MQIRHYSQFGQDVIVLGQVEQLNISPPYFFVEAGAGNGVFLSNTFLLEQNNWNGICVEANPYLFEELKKNRQCYVIQEVLGEFDDKEITFEYHGEPTCSRTVEDSKKSYDTHLGHHEIVKKKTKSLNTILKEFNAPETITYLSLDTEGTELEILRSLSDKYTIQILSIEHQNSEEKRKEIKNFVEENLNLSFWLNLNVDDIYINNSVIKT